MRGNVGTVPELPGMLLCSRRSTKPTPCTFSISIAKATAILENLSIYTKGYRRPLRDIEEELASIANPKHEFTGRNSIPFNERNSEDLGGVEETS
jgi:hypothetical protein